jgi:hypothetical protein
VPVVPQNAKPRFVAGAIVRLSASWRGERSRGWVGLTSTCAPAGARSWATRAFGVVWDALIRPRAALASIYANV